ncbi:MAG: hypothetical protein D3923_07370 [Candidatus Electrothrix sp. AR3]|nr:hypothetical protein [Candidatus Electrothrix sp. AR3]
MKSTRRLYKKDTLRKAVHILILSPIYFQMPVPQRLNLVKEYCQEYCLMLHQSPNTCQLNIALG